MIKTIDRVSPFAAAAYAYNGEKRHSKTYTKHRKCKCANHDGSVTGYLCTHNYDIPLFIDGTSILDVDHIDKYGDRLDEDNCQTLCPTCHRIKSALYGDLLPKRMRPDPKVVARKIRRRFLGLSAHVSVSTVMPVLRLVA